MTGYDQKENGTAKHIKKRKRTGVEAKDDDRQYQGYPILVRTQDPSPPNHDAVGDNILSQIPRRQPESRVSSGMLAELRAL